MIGSTQMDLHKPYFSFIYIKLEELLVKYITYIWKHDVVMSNKHDTSPGAHLTKT